MKKIYTLIISICSIFSINATDYLVSTNYTPGNVTEYQQRLFIPGVTLFSSISEVLNQIQPGDNIFLSADTYSENITLDVDNISIFGHNSWKDVRSGKRDTSNESIIT